MTKRLKVIYELLSLQSREQRLVEAKKDVVLLLDSITRLSRAYNAASGKSGRTGGLDVRALENRGKFFFRSKFGRGTAL